MSVRGVSVAGDKLVILSLYFTLTSNSKNIYLKTKLKEKHELFILTLLINALCSISFVNVEQSDPTEELFFWLLLQCLVVCVKHVTVCISECVLI